MSNEKQPEFVTMTATANIEAAGDEKQLPRFRMVAYTGGLMRVAGFPRPVVVDLAGLEIPNQNLPIRLDHERRQGVGHTQRVAIENGSLVAEGLISRDTSWARDVAKSGGNGFPWQASIGAAVMKADFVPAGGTVQVNGQTFTGPVHVVRRAILKEISFVDSGADANTSAKVAAKYKEQNVMEDKDTKTVETTEDKDTDVQAQDIGGMEAANPVADLRAQAAAESRRIAAIHKLCASDHSDIEAKAIEEGWNETKCELEVLRASRPKAPAIHNGGHDAGPKVLEAAAMMTGGIGGDVLIASHGQEAVEVADKKFRHGIGLQQLLLEAAWANGCDVRHFRDDPDGILQAAFSTFSLPGILSNVANKFLLAGFESVETAWRNIAATRSVKDFKTVTSYRLTGGFE